MCGLRGRSGRPCALGSFDASGALAADYQLPDKQGWAIVVMVHGAAIQLEPAPTNVLISYIIGVGGYFFYLLKCHGDPYRD